jgi:hypothetical protein
MVSVYVAESVLGPPESETTNVAVVAPVSCGVPVMAPVGLNDRPRGRLELSARAQLRIPLPPNARN